MNLGDVMDDLAAALGTVDGLNIYPYPTETLNPPAAVVAYPDDVEFDGGYARGMDRMTIPIVIVEGRVTARSSRDRLAEFCDGDGPRSIKASLEAYEFSAFDSIRVMSIEFDTFTMSGADYIAAAFDCDVVGPGTSTT